ncbi:MAG TPA: COX15/CtaA family protein [Actinophytocola sp.]|uniref:COX15/CtaA family protein n=1 Tax=Actinophytocola sp. TaxID=1872138 RepID=UPI002DDC97A5|nr:COX15/CtaA family protein [Actinophytocola sp.]HEV2780849.1 COX15/CtaA family protein [Actinophytocola sp.]
MRLIDRLPSPGRRLQRACAIAVVATQALIAVTGSIVRVTGSGLGCPTWPECFPGSMTPVEHPEFAALNQWIEYGNRLFTGVVGIIALACFALALLTRPRRRRYVRLAAAMPLGVLAQGVLGGITVRFDLLWWTVAVHFLASTVMVWLAVLLVHAIDEGDQPPRAVGPRGVRGLLLAQTGVLAGLLVAGTLVTGAGPHAGDPRTPRLDVPVDTVAHVHAAFLFVFLGLLLAVGVLLGTGAPRSLWARYAVLVAVVLAQGSLGFVQYWTGVPEVLVSLHVLGAMLVIIATATLWCATRDHGPVPVDEEGATRDTRDPGADDRRPGGAGVHRDRPAVPTRG